MLHVTNGDSAAEAIRSTGVDGDLLVWRDVLHEGPVPADAPVIELRELRAGFLSRCGWGDRQEVLAELAARDSRLDQALRRDEEIVLWFESDLYDQLQLLQVLDRLSVRTSPRASLVQTAGYLGLMSSADLVAAYAGARPLEPADLEFGAAAWRAFRSPDPREIETLVEGGLKWVQPAATAALRRHLEQFPGLDDGLSRSERQVVAALAAGPLPFEELFDRAQRDEEQRFLGDAVFRFYLEQLAAPPSPALVGDEDGESWDLTDFGRHVLEDGADRLASARIDRWLGGVRLLTPDRVWRWDREAGLLRPPPAVGR